MEKPKKLPKGAYGGISGAEYVPYISDASQKGGNAAVLLIGLVLAIVFAASTAYSGMKAGMTVAAGIPGSIVGSALVAVFARQRGILGKNLTQVMASGGESIASGMIFVLPAVILIGSQVNFLEGFLVGVGGVAFGIGIASIVYKYLVIEEHGKLMYPESMAISETLVSGETGGESLKFMGIGFGIGGGLTLFTGAFLNLANNVVDYFGKMVYKWRFSLEANPMLVGIGFIVGLETALNMFAGSFLASFAIVPLVAYFSELAADHIVVWNNTELILKEIGVGALSGNYVRYVGAGMMLCGGIIGALRLIPAITASIKETIQAQKSGETGSSRLGIMILVIGIALGFIISFMISGSIAMAITGAVLILLLSMLFVIVAGRLTGVVGTSNLPVSGMTIASLVIMTLVFVIMGWTGLADNKVILLLSTFIVVAISAGGGYAQSHKATYIIGGPNHKSETDKFFFIAGIAGVATVVGITILLSSQLAITGDNPPFALPQANMMKTLTSGIMQGDLPWTLILAGMAIALFFFFLKLPVMSIAVGFYLPIATTAAVLLGALIRVFIEKTAKDEADKETKVTNGVGISSGLIAGASIIGLIGIILHVFGVIDGAGPVGFAAGNGMGIIFVLILVVSMLAALMRKKN
jgi:putative OPT family oligopeptide transporter